MPHLTTDDGVKLYYEEAGEGFPIVFVHEFAGDHRSYEPQMRHFSRRYRCIAYNARGYPPSDVPAEAAKYSQARACDDIRAVLDGLRIGTAHVVGISMGGFATLHFGMRHGDRARSLVIGGCGYGAEKGKRAQFQDEAEHAAQMFDRLGMAEGAKRYALGATRVQLQNKDPRGWLLTGDEDDPCIEASVLMKRSIATAGLAILPKTGHALNLEEPALFNTLVGDFFHQVEAGRWSTRDPRSITDKIL
jgi:pimeloyl-ACP methyl ester carboxylesterase